MCPAPAQPYWNPLIGIFHIFRPFSTNKTSERQQHPLAQIPMRQGRENRKERRRDLSSSLSLFLVFFSSFFLSRFLREQRNERTDGPQAAGVADCPCLLLLFAFSHGDGSKENSNAASTSIHRRYQLPPPSPPPSTPLPPSSSPQLSTTTDKKLGEAPLFEMAWCTRRSITLQRTKLIPVEQLHPTFAGFGLPERPGIFEFNDEPLCFLFSLFSSLLFACSAFYSFRRFRFPFRSQFLHSRPRNVRAYRIHPRTFSQRKPNWRFRSCVLEIRVSRLIGFPIDRKETETFRVHYWQKNIFW